LQEHAVLVVAQPDGRIPFVTSRLPLYRSVSGMNNQQVSIGKWAATVRQMGRFADGVPGTTRSRGSQHVG